MTKNKKYHDGYDMAEMVYRVVYWWARYQGLRTEDGKDYSKGDLKELIYRLNELHDNPDNFNFNHPDMNTDDYCDECGDELDAVDEDLGGFCSFCYHELNDVNVGLDVNHAVSDGE